MVRKGYGRRLSDEKPAMQRSGQKTGSIRRGPEIGLNWWEAAGRGKPLAVWGYNMGGDEVTRWWALLAQGFLAISRSWQGWKYDEGQLAFHQASKLWGFMVSLSIRASWHAEGGESSLKKLGRGDLPPPSRRLEAAEYLQWPES